MGKYEVTQKQWREVMGDNPSIFEGENLAVHQVSWDEVTDFIETLNDQAGTDFRLPTEAEWEYVCRAGSNTPHGFDPELEDLSDHAWYALNSNTRVYPPAQKRPNAWGVYDMLGNVREWCQDWVGVYPMKKFPITWAAWKDGSLVELETLDGPTEVDYAGTGFMLIKREVLEGIEAPLYEEQGPCKRWFHADVIDDGAGPFYCSEDYWFCREARKAGFKVIMDPKAKLTHWGTHAYG